MKFNVLNNEPLQFYDANGVLIGTIEISGSGDMIIRPESGSSKDIILGNRDTVGDVEIGLPSAAAGLKFMGGGTISANGNTLTIGDNAVGDSVVIAVPITASNVQSASFAISASHLIGGGGGSVPAGTVSGSGQITLLGFVTSSATASFVTNSQTSSMSVLTSSFAVTSSHALTAANAGTTVVANPGSSGGGALSTITIGGTSFSVGGGGGGSSIFTAGDGFQKTINNLIVSQSNDTSSLTVINSGSTVFDVRGSVGQLFEVQDGLDGVLMSVNDISGIPILTVSSSGDVILAEGSTLQGTAATASFVAGVSAAFPFAGAAVITGSLDITGSGDDIFKVRSSSGSLFSVDNGLDGILMSVNDISGLPLFEISSSGNVELVTGNISGSALSTASFGHLLVNGVSISGSSGGGGGSTDISALNAFTASANTSLSALDTFTGSANTSITALNSATGSFATTASVNLQDLTITNLSGSLIPGDGSTSSIAVTVVDDGANRFVLDGEKTASLNLTAGNAYRFDQSDSSNNNHPIAFKLASDSSTSYTTLVSASGVPGNAGASTLLSVTNATPNLIYYCTVHGNGMGGGAILTIITGSQIQNGFLEVSGSTRLSGSLDVLTDITASGNISSTNITSSGYMLITSSNTGGGGAGSMTPGLVINQIGSSQNYSGPAIRLVNATNGEESNIYHQPGGSGAANGNALNIISNGGINIEAGDDLGSGGAFFRLQKGQALFTIDDDGSAPRTDVKIHNGNGGTAYSRLSLGASSQYWYIEADDNSTPFNIGFDNGSSDTDVITFTKHDGSLTGSLTITGSLTVSGSANFTNATVTGLSSNPFPFTGAGQVTGSLIISSSNSTASLSLRGSGSTLFEVIGSEGTIFSLDDELDGTLFTVNDRSGIPQLLVSSSGRIEAEEGEAVIRSQRPIVTVGTNPFTASADNAGQYFRVGGNVTCSIFVSASVSCPIGAEFDFFQTSSAGNMLFETGSGVTLNSKNGNLNLAGQFSSATLKYVNNDEWDLMGDLT